MDFDGPPPLPGGYTTSQPARIVLDIPGVASTVPHHPARAGDGAMISALIKQVSVVTVSDRIRVILALSEPVPYAIRVADHAVYVVAGGDAWPRLIEDIDFRRGDAGEGRLLVRLKTNPVETAPGDRATVADAEVTRAGRGIKMLFTNTTLPDKLHRRLDVTGFNTPVQWINAFQQGTDTVMMVEPSGETDYFTYQTNDIHVLEVRPTATSSATTASATPAGMASGFKGEKLSLNFQDIEIRSVLQLLADFTNLNLIVSDTVTGRMTLRLKQVPWDQALDLVLKTRGLDKRLQGNVLMIAPTTELQAQDQLELERRRQQQALAPLRTEFFKVKYARAQEIFTLFEQTLKTDSHQGDDWWRGLVGQGVISPRGSVIVDERTNAIILTDTQERIAAFQAVLERLDIPVRQVLIEARIVTATTSFGKSLGVRWGALGSAGNGKVGFGGSLTTVAKIRKATGHGPFAGSTAFKPDENLIVDLGVSGRASSFAFGIVDKHILLELELSALETEGRGEVIARPKVITADKQQAWIASGDQIPYQEASSSGATSVKFVDAVLGLKVTPRITPDDRILLDLEVNQDSIGAIFNGIPSIRTNSIKTQVLVGDEETIVLGGVFQTVIAKSVSKTPVLGDLPVIGRLFRRQIRSEDKQELLIFITPRLIRE